MGNLTKPFARAVLAALLVAAPLAAQTPQERATARLLAEEGAKHLEAKNPKAALDAFRRAHQLVPAPTLLLAMGRAHVELGELVEGHERFLEAMRSPVGPKDPPAWKRAVEEADKERAAVFPRIPVLVVKLDPPGGTAKVTLDGTALAPASLGAPIPVNPGKHVVAVEGGASLERTLAERERGEVTLKISPAAAPPASTAPTATSAAPPPATTTAPGPSTTPATHSEPKKSAWSAVTVPAFVASGVFLVVGAATGLSAKSKMDDVKSSCTGTVCPSSAKSDRDKAYRLADVSTVSFALSVALGGLGVFAATRPAVEADKTGLRLGVHGAF